MSETETWKNATKGTAFILKHDRMGNETHELVVGGRSFSLTKAERMLNSDRAANSDLDIFRNGTLTPVRLLDGDEDAAEITANPNLMGQDDMAKLFKGHWRTFESKVSEIKNPLVLERMLEIASEVDATVRQVGIVQSRLSEVAPANFVERDVQTMSSPTPAAPAPNLAPETGTPLSPR